MAQEVTVSGIPGSGGPIPKREAQRRRTNSPPADHAQSATAEPVEQPEAEAEWHPLAAEWYLSLGKSGQSAFYEASDWAQARIWADLLSKTMRNGKGPSAMLVTAWAAGAAELLTTEGARRRMRLELERERPVDADAEAADATVTSLIDRLGG